MSRATPMNAIGYFKTTVRIAIRHLHIYLFIYLSPQLGEESDRLSYATHREVDVCCSVELRMFGFIWKSAMLLFAGNLWPAITLLGDGIVREEVNARLIEGVALMVMQNLSGL
ncbi:hypothetical protein CDAR_606681 [Caerostris darwini]|uniref:Uncharacterized protein n=1 Tax=Caerostris darwini TaxID=1538125 RepID=A0AAV4U351_9ARAC|nr:hypothetical protein CDAR_606681 [Caerostris darwini]